MDKKNIHYFQKDIETMPRAELEKLQLERLKALVKYCMDNIPFYNKRLTEAGVSADKIKVLSDIEYIPYTKGISTTQIRKKRK